MKTFACSPMGGPMFRFPVGAVALAFLACSVAYPDDETKSFVAPSSGKNIVTDVVTVREGRSPGETYEVESGDTSVLVTREGEEVLFLSFTGDAAWGFSPDQHRFVAYFHDGTQHTVHLFNLESWSPGDARWGPADSVWSEQFLTGEARIAFSPNGNHLLYAALAGANQFNLILLDAKTGAPRHDDSFFFAQQPGRDDDVRQGVAWGFGPDFESPSFAYAWITAEGQFKLKLVNLNAGSAVLDESPFTTPAAFWRFSPCGDALGLVHQHGSDHMWVRLHTTVDGAQLFREQFPVGNAAFHSTEAAHFATVTYIDFGGQPQEQKIELGPNVAGIECVVDDPEPDGPAWPDGAELAFSEVADESVTVDWPGALSDNGIEAYRIFRNGIAIATLGGDEHSYTATGLSAEQTYTFAVEAADSLGNWSERLTGSVTTGETPEEGLLDGRISAVALREDKAPDGDGWLAFFDSNPVINNTGDAFFLSWLEDTDRDEGYFSGRGEAGRPLTSYVRFGDPVPEVPDSAFSTLYFHGITVNDSAQIAFQAFYDDPELGFTNTGLFLADGTNITPIIFGGDPMPHDEDKTFSYILNVSPIINEPGQVAFTADRHVFLREPDGSIARLVGQGDEAPGGEPFEAFSAPELNNAGQVAFWARMPTEFDGFDPIPDEGIYRHYGNALVEIVRSGDPVPGSDDTFDFIDGNPALNDHGQVAFRGGGGFYLGDGDELVELVRGGDRTPNDTGYFGIANLQWGLNNAGQTAITSDMRDDDDEFFRGVYRSEGDELIHIAEAGDPAPYGVFEQIDFWNAINESGTVAFQARETISGQTERVLYLGDGQDLVRVVRANGTRHQGKKLTGFEIFRDDRSGRSFLNDDGQVTFYSSREDHIDGIFVFTPTLGWRGGNSGNWDDEDNWTLGQRPRHHHHVAISSPGGSTSVSGPPQSTTTGSVVMYGAAAGNPTEASITSLSLSEIVFETIEGLSLEGYAKLDANGTTLEGPLTIEGPNNTVSAVDTVFGGDMEINPAGEILIEGGNVTFNGAVFVNDAAAGTGGEPVSVSFEGIDGESWTFAGTVRATSRAVFDIPGPLIFKKEVAGSAPFPGTGPVHFLGGYRPGNSTASIPFGGELHLGPENTLVMEMAGTGPGLQYDRLEAAGTLEFDGSLSIALIAGFRPAEGDAFEIFDFGGSAGTFAVLDLPELANGLAWETSELYTDGVLRVVSRPQVTFQDWLEEHLEAEELAEPVRTDPAGDPGGFGIANLLRYAFDLDPRNPGHGDLPTLAKTQNEEDGTLHLTITFTRRTDAADLVYTVEAGDDLNEWTPLGNEHILQAVPLGNGIEEVTFRDPVPIPEANTRFLRVLVEMSD